MTENEKLALRLLREKLWLAIHGYVIACGGSLDGMESVEVGREKQRAIADVDVVVELIRDADTHRGCLLTEVALELQSAGVTLTHITDIPKQVRQLRVALGETLLRFTEGLHSLKQSAEAMTSEGEDCRWVVDDVDRILLHLSGDCGGKLTACMERDELPTSHGPRCPKGRS